MRERAGLSLGPILFHWPVSKWRKFYHRIADEAPVDTVYLGEVVCSKREPFYAEAKAEVAERLRRNGKTVVLSTLALVTQSRERKACTDIALNPAFDIEVNDISVMRHLPQGRSFHVGPFINVYNEASLEFFAQRGAKAICLLPELPMEAVEILTRSVIRLGLQCEIWAFGRLPLAISSRCYTARVCGLAKDSCQFVCAQDPDGRTVETVDGHKFLAINGIQTLSYHYLNLVGHIDDLRQSGVGCFRLSPQDCDMVEVARLFRARLDGQIEIGEAQARINTTCGDAAFSN